MRRPLGLLCLLACAGAAELELARGDLHLTVALPGDGYYRANRFDHGGIVTAATWHGHAIFGLLKQPRNPDAHDGSGGAPEEFDAEHQPPGFAETAPGGMFLKIGVGALVRPDATPYRFMKPYRLAVPATATVTTGPGWVSCRQEAAAGAWACRSTRTIRLHDDGDGFTIERELTATGTMPLATEQYNHCMLAIDGDPIGPAYTLRLPAGAAAEHRQLVAANGVLGFTAVIPPAQSVWARVHDLPPGPDGAGLEVTDAARGVSVRLSGDTAPDRLVVYAEATALCPEAFTVITVAPGETRRWSQTFRFAPVPAPAPRP